MSGRQKASRRERMTQTFTFFDWEDVAYNAVTETFLDLTPSSASGFANYSQQIANLCDMYRFAKIERFIMECSCDQSLANTLGTDDAWAGWILSYVAPGAAPPTNLLGIETEHAMLGSGHGGTHWSRVKLDMKASDFAVLADAGPGPGWIPTQADGPATSFGSIQMTSTTPAGSVNEPTNFSWKVTITMSFDSFVDPATIALRLQSKKPVPRLLKERNKGKQTRALSSEAAEPTAEAACTRCACHTQKCPEW